MTSLSSLRPEELRQDSLLPSMLGVLLSVLLCSSLSISRKGKDHWSEDQLALPFTSYLVLVLSRCPLCYRNPHPKRVWDSFLLICLPHPPPPLPPPAKKHIRLDLCLPEVLVWVSECFS